MTLEDCREPKVELERFYAKPCGLVFKAWTSADHVKNWFPPIGYSALQCKVEPRVDGVFELVMHAEDGSNDHWMRGKFTALAPPNSLAFDANVTQLDGTPLFSAATVVTFNEEGDGTRVHVVQTYSINADPEMIKAMMQGAPIGWGQSLDKLGAEIERVPAVTHSTFQIERTYAASVDRVFLALSDSKAKAKWFAGGTDSWKPIEQSMDFRVGGREVAKGRWIEGGVVTSFEALYHDIIPLQRIVYSYVMHINATKISVSLATIELDKTRNGTHLRVTEQGTFLNGYDDNGSREHGTKFLLEALGASLAD
ncbi:MAG: SRPBCC domain-containing protein [Clostridia bacterium]|nr:SRPBCC domain-containing protein [Deltaproteobacteria bacterium]